MIVFNNGLTKFLKILRATLAGQYKLGPSPQTDSFFPLHLCLCTLYQDAMLN